MSGFRFANVMNNTTINNTFNSNNNNIANIKTKRRQIMATITNCYYFYQNQLFFLNQFYCNTAFIRPIYKPNCLNIIVNNILSRKRVKNQ